jgi:hypothetical protein
MALDNAEKTKTEEFYGGREAVGQLTGLWRKVNNLGNKSGVPMDKLRCSEVYCDCGRRNAAVTVAVGALTKNCLRRKAGGEFADNILTMSVLSHVSATLSAVRVLCGAR